MHADFTFKLRPAEAANHAHLLSLIARTAGAGKQLISGFHILKQSIDARGKQPWINLLVRAYINEAFPERPLLPFRFDTLPPDAPRVIIIGAGPAGLFAALSLIEKGIRPVLLERGKDVRSRRRDLAQLNKAGEVNPESNYCFGEGGAGTYSDGKLYTRSSKRGDIQRILHLFVHFGADERILYEAHPHIGTNKLPQIITAMREQIEAVGGSVLFQKKMTDLVIEHDTVKGVHTADGDTLMGDAVILATGHSARDIFRLLHAKKISIEAKPFALGVRIEHPQQLIDTAQYHQSGDRDPFLPPASYNWVEQVNGHGVFSFCMCPGGIIAPAATEPGEVVVNGWSPSKRNNPYANSGIVVTIDTEEAWQFLRNENKSFTPDDPLLLLHFQQQVERDAFAAGGGKLVAPAQRMADFAAGTVSTSLPRCSYLPGIHSADLSAVLPPFVHQSLQAAFRSYGKKMRGYFTNEAVVVATESRTSSPVRIPRDPEHLQHPQLKNLYPCGEGAGYAGGIVSAAMDGERIAARIALTV